MKIVAFHIYNDYSGSPKVLSMVVKGLLNKGCQVDLLTSCRGGILDELENLNNFKIFRHFYKFYRNPVITLLLYLYTQLYEFFFAFKYVSQKNTVFYLNTLMPIGAAIAGKIIRKKVVYHYHENANVKGVFYKSLAFMMQKLADEIICVSEYQRSFLERNHNISVIPNALPLSFENACKPISVKKRNRDSILMLSSLKVYKGVLEFVKLARCLPQYHFELVINDTNDNINLFISKHGLEISSNLKIWDRQTNVLPFYERNSLVVNLSKKELFIETFGLTALEAMASGLPVIVPTVGGISEMIINGYNGYKVDAEDFDKLQKTILLILNDEDSYGKMKENAINYAMNYSNSKMIDSIETILNHE